MPVCDSLTVSFNSAIILLFTSATEVLLFEVLDSGVKMASKVLIPWDLQNVLCYNFFLIQSIRTIILRDYIG